MDYKLIQKADRELIYYGIYNTVLETVDGGDILSKIRQKYFETGKRQKNRSTYNIMGTIYRCSYNMEEDKPLKWKKLIGSQLAEYSAICEEGYYIESVDREKHPYKRAYYDNSHTLLRVEFFSKNDKNTPVCSVVPSTDGERSVLVRKGSDTADVLYPFEQVVDKELTENLNSQSGMPEIFCRTNSGSYYFCNETEAEKRQAMLDEIFERENSSSGRLESDGIVKPSFDIDSADFEVKEPTEKHSHVEEGGNKDYVDSIIRQNEGEDNIPTAALNDSHKYDRKIDDIHGQSCTYLSECPYELMEKLIIESGESKYYYYGEVVDDKRSGMGRTAMSNGKTAYEGGYKDDKRDGFGVYYYKSGKLCYVGSWKQNKREGLGIAFSPNDGSVFVGDWQNNTSCGIGASFDKDGRFVYLGKTKDGKRNGAAVTYSAEGDNFFVGKYKDGEFSGTGTQFDSEGNMLYVGEYKNNIRIGTGISYKSDGSVCYNGEWNDNLYNGKGTLYFDDGKILRGTFRNGRAYGKCSLTDRTGRLIYMGSFENDVYNGAGRLFLENGAYVEGNFTDGEPTGIFNEYNRNNHLVYCGEWSNGHRNGRGVEYANGEKVYDGGFVNSVYEGSGTLYKDDIPIYSGTFRNGMKCGLGAEYSGNEIIYFGMWENDCHSGCGILYENGTARYVGQFRDNKRHGRINEIYDGKVIRKCLYSDDVLTYMCEYSEDNIMIYFGNVSDGKRNGMGCSYNNLCEKEFEGIFKNDMPEKTMQVFYKQLEDLPECEQLRDTEYEKFRLIPEYAIDMSYEAGKYTGCLSNGIPEGKGTLLFCDHRYTGIFSKGLADGMGIIYMSDGRELRGKFSTRPLKGSKRLHFADTVYYVIAD